MGEVLLWIFRIVLGAFSLLGIIALILSMFTGGGGTDKTIGWPDRSDW